MEKKDIVWFSMLGIVCLFLIYATGFMVGRSGEKLPRELFRVSALSPQTQRLIRAFITCHPDMRAEMKDFFGGGGVVTADQYLINDAFFECKHPNQIQINEGN